MFKKIYSVNDYLAFRITTINKNFSRKALIELQRNKFLSRDFSNGKSTMTFSVKNFYLVATAIRESAVP